MALSLFNLNAHTFSPTLSGYQQVYSERGRLYFLPEELHFILLEENPVPIIFQPREQRPHRIHIARVHPDDRPAQGGVRKRRRIRVSIIFTKLAGSKDSARRLLKSFIASNSDPSNPNQDRPISWVSTRTSRSSVLLLGRRARSGARGESQERAQPENMRPGFRHSIAAPLGGPVGRLSISQDEAVNLSTPDLTADSPTSFGTPMDKPLASGSGVSFNINLAEPVLFLQGYEQGDLQANRSTAMLRGSLQLRVSKAAKIKAVTLRFRGRALTKWPEGIPPKKTEFEEATTQMSHTWPFFNSQFPTAETSTGADRVELFKSADDISKTKSSIITLSRSPMGASTNNTKELKKLSLQVNQARSFEKGGNPTGGPSVAQKGYRTFQPGDYTYNFELPLDSHLPETIDVELGSVKYELEAIVERAGAFKANLVGARDVLVIRTPAEGSLEQVEPIAISRNWEDQLHYDIVISGKSFPLGAQVPIAFKLTPLAKVQCHRIKVFVTESVEYFCNNKRVHRMEPTRKLQLFEKRADGPPTSTFPGSTMRIVSGGGIPYDMRAAAARGEHVPSPDPTNLLGNLEEDRSVGPTEMEFNVQLPSCINTKDKDKNMRLHFDTTYSNIQVHHWIKIVMRLSRPDAADPTKRRHFEISIDSPFHILSCRATQANTALPAYTGPPTVTTNTTASECGCPGAIVRRNSPASFLPTLNHINATNEASHDATRRASVSTITAGAGGVPERDAGASMSPTSGLRHSWHPNSSNGPPGMPMSLQRPQAAHLNGPTNPAIARPMHIIRAPSFQPPSFDEEEPPPPLETPPPQYDTIASPTNGLADYFARLSNAYSTEGGSDSDSGGEGARTPTGTARVEQPLTPGASRSSRSLDEARRWIPIGTGNVLRMEQSRESIGTHLSLASTGTSRSAVTAPEH